MLPRYAVTRRWKRLPLHGFDAFGAALRHVWPRQAVPPRRAVRRILLVRRERFGDLILLQPALRRAQALFPRAELTLLVNPEYAGFCSAAFPWVRVATEAGRERYDLALEFLADARLLWQARRRARVLAGYGLRGGGWLCDLELTYPHHTDTALRSLQLVEAAAGVPPTPAPGAAATPRLTLTPLWARAAMPLLRALPGEFLIAHPGCGDPEKAWPLERWRALLGACRARGWQVVITGSAAERAAYATLPGRNWAGVTTLGSLAGLVAAAAVVIAPDTGIVHLARALGVPAVALFGPTDPEVWSSPDARQWTIAYPRMADIPVHVVLAALESAVSIPEPEAPRELARHALSA